MGIAGDFVLVIIAGFFGALLARALRLPTLVGYVIAGVAVGPHTSGPSVVQAHDIELLAEIGVALLLFSLGLEVSLGDLKPVWRVALIGGPIQILATILAVGYAADLLLNMGFTESVWFGSMVCLSSTMVVLKNLAEAGTTSTLASRVMIGFLVVQDLAVVPMLIILPQLGDLQNALPNLGKAALTAGGFLAAMVIIGTRVLPAVMARVASWGSREMFLVTVVAIGVGVGIAAHAVGISFALGAFIAGIVLSESELSHQAMSDVVPLRDVFGLLFFVSVGMLFDPGFILRHPWEVIAVLGFIILAKALITGVITRLFGYGNLAPWIAGLGLAQVGEFSFVLARSGQAMNAISKDTYDLTLTSTILTIALSPLLAKVAPSVGRFFRSRWSRAKTLDTVSIPNEKLTGHAIVVGAGRTGLAVAKLLHEVGQSVELIEADYTRFTQVSSQGLPCIFGDATRDEILHAAHLDTAQSLIISVPNSTVVRMIVHRVNALRPGLPVVARATHHDDLTPLRQAGGDALRIVLPEFEGGLEMARQALANCQHDPDEINHLVNEFRLRFQGGAAA